MSIPADAASCALPSAPCIRIAVPRKLPPQAVATATAFEQFRMTLRAQDDFAHDTERSEHLVCRCGSRWRRRQIRLSTKSFDARRRVSTRIKLMELN